MTGSVNKSDLNKSGLQPAQSSRPKLAEKARYNSLLKIKSTTITTKSFFATSSSTNSSIRVYYLEYQVPIASRLTQNANAGRKQGTLIFEKWHLQQNMILTSNFNQPKKIASTT